MAYETLLGLTTNDGLMAVVFLVAAYALLREYVDRKIRGR